MSPQSLTAGDRPHAMSILSFMFPIMHYLYMMHNQPLTTRTALMTMMALALAASPTTAQTYQLEKTPADLLFSINHAGFTEKHGSFREFDATLYYDARKPENSHITVTVKTRTGYGLACSRRGREGGSDSRCGSLPGNAF
jgi:hypothetical protein